MKSEAASRSSLVIVVAVFSGVWVGSQRWAWPGPEPSVVCAVQSANDRRRRSLMKRFHIRLCRSCMGFFSSAPDSCSPAFICCHYIWFLFPSLCAPVCVFLFLVNFPIRGSFTWCPPSLTGFGSRGKTGMPLWWQGNRAVGLNKTNGAAWSNSSLP